MDPRHDDPSPPGDGRPPPPDAGGPDGLDHVFRSPAPEPTFDERIAATRFPPAVTTAVVGAAYHAHLGWQTWSTFTTLPAFVQTPLLSAVQRNATPARLAGLVAPIAALVGLGIARALVTLAG